MIMIIARRSSNWQIFQLILVICCCFVAVSNAVPVKEHSTEHGNDEYVKGERLQMDGLATKKKMPFYETDEYGDITYISEESEYDSSYDSDYLYTNIIEEINDPYLRRMPKKKSSGNKHNSTKRVPVEDLIASAINIDCSSAPNKDQRFSSSFVDLSKRRDMADHKDDEMEAKIMKSIHVGEDVTLCWIETTTIKENRSVVPPARLVIREYTISFENSATIPDSYLECSRLPGEIKPRMGIDEKLGEHGLFEIIDEDTKKSRIVNFTIVNRQGEVATWKYKQVQCGVGSVVTKSILEWSSDNGKNPKKRVEITVSPKLYGPDVHQPGPSTTTDRPPIVGSSDYDTSTVPSTTTKDPNETTIDSDPTIEILPETNTSVTDCCDPESTEGSTDSSESTTESGWNSTTTESTITSTEGTTTETTTDSTEETSSEGSRRSTIPTPQTGTTTTDASSISGEGTDVPETKHQLILKIKVTLEHVNEHMETENLIEIEKSIPLNEDPLEHNNNEILNQVQALNDSMSFQRLQTLFNCSSLEKLNNRISKWAVNHYHQALLPEDYQLETTSASESLMETSSQRRRKRMVNGNSNEDLRMGIDRLLDSSLAGKGRSNLNGTQEEERNRLGDNYHVLRRWTRETLAKSSDGSAGLNTLTEFSVYATP